MREFKLIIKQDEEETEAAEVFVDGAIGGNPYRFLFDTGAAKTAVIFDDYTSTFDSTEKHHSSGVFAKHSEDLITVPAIEVGPISRKDVMLVRLADRSAEAKSLLGMDLLKDLRCHFFFNESRVAVDANDEFETRYAFQDLFLDSKFHPYVDVQFGASQAKAVWDTGASVTIADMSTIEKYSGFFEEVGQSTGTDATGASMETPMFIMSGIQIGQYVFPPHTVAGVDLSHVNSTVEIPMNLILGYSTLSKAHWLFEFPRRRWAISQSLWE